MSVIFEGLFCQLFYFCLQDFSNSISAGGDGLLPPCLAACEGLAQAADTVEYAWCKQGVALHALG